MTTAPSHSSSPAAPHPLALSPRLESLAREEQLARIPLRYRGMVKRTRAIEVEFTALSDAELRERLHEVRAKIREGDSLDKHLPTVFAAACVTARHHLGMRPYHVQLVGGYELHRGRIAEMATGEGKTLVAALPAVLNAITGRGVHVITVNDYLAQRDAETLKPLYSALGLSVGVIVAGMSDEARRAAYVCDITYGTNKEFGFDYLRDQIKFHTRTHQQKIDTLSLLNRRDSTESVQRALNFAIVDEADSVLIDESRTPLIIAGPTGPSPLAWAYQWANQLSMRLRARHDFDYQPEKRKLDWKEEGLTRLQKILTETNTPSITAESWQNLVLNALRARWLFINEQHYVITQDAQKGPEVVIVDEFTGRRMPGRTWSEGLHQAVQAKENLPINAPAPTLARTTYQHYFSLYKKLSGMTGTAATESYEFKKVYKLPVVKIPTHRPIARIRHADRVFRTAREKWSVVADEVEKIIFKGRPVLVGTHSIEDSETLSRILRARDVAHQILNARPENAGKEAEIVAHAGELGMITIATNMAGRGTDIKLGPGVAELGGLHVIGTQRHESRRVDNQLVGRCGRQGDPGSAIFMISLEDPILQHLLSRKTLIRIRRKTAGLWGRDIGSWWTTALFARAQRKVESMHYRQRQQLMEYEDWLNKVYFQMGGT
ncbi:MAG TPA: DEAD/DEAH box helicase [Phycisphaerae bacterium]|nr:DEAD/DEAH box helicase [Phycisphaerae bacterium]